MVEVSLIKLPSWSCLQNNVTGTYWKSNIGSGALNDLVFILYCRVIGQWLPNNRRSVGERSATDWRSVGDCILGVCFWLKKVCNFLEISRQPIGDWSAISRRLKTMLGLSATAASGRRSVGDQSATCRRPPKTFLRSIWSQRGFTCSNQNLLGTKSSLQPSATGRRPVADLLATTLHPPCDHPKFWSQGSRRPVASYVWPGLYPCSSELTWIKSWLLLKFYFHLCSLKYDLSYPPNNEVVGGYIGFSPSIRPTFRPSVRPSVRPSLCPSGRPAVSAL